MAKTDPELIRQINEASDSDAVTAVLMLYSQGQPFLPPKKVKSIVHDLLKRVGDIVGTEAHDVNTFANLGSFVVAADARFMAELLKQPEIVSAIANRRR